MDREVKTSKRAEGKALRLELTRQWSLITLERVRDKKDTSSVALMNCFKEFCTLKGIHKPQDKTLRNHIILGAAELLRLIRERGEKKKKNEEDKK